jgi:hypothetical protein
MVSHYTSPDAMLRMGGNCDLYVASMKPDSTWGDVKNLGPNINSTGWDSHPSLTHGGDTYSLLPTALAALDYLISIFRLKIKKEIGKKP